VEEVVVSLTDEQLRRLEGIAKRLRRHIVTMIGCGTPGHLGGSCSVADIVAVLYFHKMRPQPYNPNWPQRDRFLLSKGHSVLAQYAALAELGCIPMESLKTLKVLGSMLQGHPEVDRTPGIEAYTGSLGQGLSIACGMALAARLDSLDCRVYCILGDGEIDEGQIWPASMTAAFYKLDNLTALVDKNGLSGSGAVAQFFNSNPLPDKWRAFGWHVIEINGHDIRQIAAALDEAEATNGKPTMIVAGTVKSKGVSFAENKPAFHHGVLSREQFEQAMKELAP
jgi:transketolase